MFLVALHFDTYRCNVHVDIFVVERKRKRARARNAVHNYL